MEAELLPPHNVEAEQSVLGAMLLEESAIIKAVDTLKPICFFRAEHSELFDAMTCLYAKGKSVDLVTLQTELNARGTFESVGKMGYLTALLTSVPSATAIDHYVQIVQEKYLLRRMANAGRQVLDMCLSPDPAMTIDGIMAKARNEVDTAASAKKSDMQTAHAITMRVFDNSITTRDYGSVNAVHQLPWSEINSIMRGIRRVGFSVIAARPSVGKSSFALSLARHASLTLGLRGIYKCPEMTGEELQTRMISQMIHIPAPCIEDAHMTNDQWAEYASAVESLSGIPLVYDEDEHGDSDPDLDRFVSRCRSHKDQFGLDYVIVDHIGLMVPHGKFSSRYDKATEVSHTLRAMARQLQISVIGLCQMSRPAKNTKDRNPEPFLDDLRDSGAIEEDAYSVIMLWRPQQFDKGLDPHTKQDAVAFVRKNRGGGTGDAALRWTPLYTDFSGDEDRFGPATLSNGLTGF